MSDAAAQNAAEDERPHLAEAHFGVEARLAIQLGGERAFPVQSSRFWNL
jgi:hypothetical protein